MLRILRVFRKLKPNFRFGRLGSIQNKLFITYFILIALIVFSIGIISYRVSESIIEKDVSSSRNEVIKQIGRNIGMIVNEINTITYIYSSDAELMEVMKQKKEDDYERLQAYLKLEKIFSRYMYTFNILNIRHYWALYSYNDFEFSSLSTNSYNFKSMTPREWYHDIIRKNGKIAWINTHNDNEGYGVDAYVFSTGTLIKNSYSQEALGILLLNIDETVLSDNYKSAQDIGSNIFIIDSKGNIISHVDKSRLGKSITEEKYAQEILESRNESGTFIQKKGKDVLVTYYGIPNADWRIIEEVPMEVILKPLAKMKYINMILLMVFLLVGFALSYVIARKISLPIKLLYRSMKDVRNGNLDVTLDIRSRDEIGELSSGFNKMVAKIQELMQDVRDEEHLKRKAEFDFLQAQINPHFLYNTLNSVKCMVSMGQNTAAQAMLKSFMRLLRKVYHYESELILIREELDSLKDYVTIQKIRYGDKFEMSYSIEDKVLDCKILKLSLQPLVENAIFHGIEPHNSNGMITISGYIEKSDVVLKVIDNGVGMSEDQIKQIWQKKKNSSGTAFSSVGIKNVHDRLLLNFGNEYGVRIESEPGAGTLLEVRMPVIKG